MKPEGQLPEATGVSPWYGVHPMTTRTAHSLMVCTTALVVWFAVIPSASAALDAKTGPIRKLSRGVTNTVAGVLEVPLTISKVGNEEGPVAALSWGLLNGCGAALGRTLMSVVELVTFPFPLGDVGYRPLLEPEFLLHPDQPHTPLLNY